MTSNSRASTEYLHIPYWSHLLAQSRARRHRTVRSHLAVTGMQRRTYHPVERHSAFKLLLTYWDFIAPIIKVNDITSTTGPLSVSFSLSALFPVSHPPSAWSTV